MQALKIDNLSRKELERLKQILPRFTRPALIDGVYWIPIPEELLTPVQAAHTECQPHFFAVELGENFISFEFLARTHQRVRCECISPATAQQKVFLMQVAQKIFQEAGVEMKRV